MAKWENFKKTFGDAAPWDLLNKDKYVEDDNTASKRFEICKQCPELVNLTKQCKKCGCFMSMKVLLAEAECPIGKWGKEVVQ